MGDVLPDFERTDHEGRVLRAADLRAGKGWSVLYFYPKDNTPACTAQGCAFRDAFEQFTQVGATVVGISGDSDDSHRAFAAKHRLPFRLVSDADGSLRQLLGVPKTLWLFPGRVTYVCDPTGVVRLIFSSQLGVGKHIERALEVISGSGAAARR